MVNPKTVLKIAGLILLILSGAFLMCIPVAVIYSEPLAPFLYSALITATPGMLLFFTVKRQVLEKISVKEGYLNVTLGWVIMIVAGMLPYIFSNTIPGFINFLFETTSGFTTTGASILRDVEILPKSILFYRSLTHWIGGIGIILLVIIILPTLKVGGYNLFSLESSMKQKLMPRTKSIAAMTLLIYLTLTVGQVVMLSLGDMNLFDSICHSFGTVATGGFSTKNSSIAGYSVYSQYVMAIFMFLSATSYVVYYYTVKSHFRKIQANEEFWFYIFFVTAFVVMTTLVLYTGTDRSFGVSFRHSFFQVISQISCSGFATTDYTLWPQAGWILMFLLMFAGGSTGSTTGGIKMARHLISLKNLRSVFIRLQHQNAVVPIKLNGQIIPENINNLMMIFIMLYVIIFTTGALLMITSGIPAFEAAGASATSMAGLGPGLGASGNMGNYAHFNGFSKIIMVLLMIIGRLELFTILALFTKSFWKK